MSHNNVLQGPGARLLDRRNASTGRKKKPSWKVGLGITSCEREIDRSWLTGAVMGRLKVDSNLSSSTCNCPQKTPCNVN